MPIDLRASLTSESDRLEWGESPDDDSKLFEAVCALANDLGDSGMPGYLLLGVDRTGRVVGVDESRLDGIQQVISNRLCSTKLLPHPSCSVTPYRHEGKTLIVVEVTPYPVPPLVTVNGTAWVRQASTTRRASDADILRLQERRPERSQPFDTRPLPNTSLDDLDRTLLDRQYQEHRQRTEAQDAFPDLPKWLTQRQLGRFIRGQWTPNAAALLLYGITPQNFLPGAIVEFVRYGGESIEAPISTRKTITGSLPDQLQVLWSQLNAHLTMVGTVANGIVTPYMPRYPAEALKELARNLVQHRLYESTNAPGRVEWFEDRIEFSNPGGPYGRASDGVFGTNSDYRNPTITQGLVELGYVERLGRGLELVRRSLEKNGNPPFEVMTDGFTRVIVRARS